MSKVQKRSIQEVYDRSKQASREHQQETSSVAKDFCMRIKSNPELIEELLMNLVIYIFKARPRAVFTQNFHEAFAKDPNLVTKCSPKALTYLVLRCICTWQHLSLETKALIAGFVSEHIKELEQIERQQGKLFINVTFQHLYDGIMASGNVLKQYDASAFKVEMQEFQARLDFCKSKSAILGVLEIVEAVAATAATAAIWYFCPVFNQNVILGLKGLLAASCVARGALGVLVWGCLKLGD